jgi:hypothetical protein
VQFWQTPLEGYLLERFNDFYDSPERVVRELHRELFGAFWMENNPYSKTMASMDLRVDTLIKVYTDWLEAGKAASAEFAAASGLDLKEVTKKALVQLMVTAQDIFLFGVSVLIDFDDSWYTEPATAGPLTKLKSLAIQCSAVDPLVRLSATQVYMLMANELRDQGLVDMADFTVDIVQGTPTLLPTGLSPSDFFVASKLNMHDSIVPKSWTPVAPDLFAKRIGTP